MGRFAFLKELSPAFVPLNLETRLESSEVKPNGEKRMRESCFEKRDSIEPVCGVHKVKLIQDRISFDLYAPGLGQITCFICPASHLIARDKKAFYARNSI